MEITKGKWEQSHRIIDEEDNYNTQVYNEDKVIRTLDWAGHKEYDVKTITSRRGANAKLIAEAGTVANETGFSPRELADHKAELLEILKLIILNEVALEQEGKICNISGPVFLKALQIINKAKGIAQ